MDDITITDVRAVPGDSAFLIHNEKCAILYDSGFAFSGVAVLDNIKQVLGDRRLDFILLTHSHYDHVLGVPNLLEAYPNVKVVASAYAAHIFTRASAKQTMRELNKKAAQHLGLPPKDHLIEKLRVDIPVKDGDIIDCADLRFRVIALPGHTKCSVGYYLEENNLLLGVETLGVYFGNNTYSYCYSNLRTGAACSTGFSSPKWLAGDRINELEFCKAFLEQYPMICIHGTFFTADGRVTDENKLKKKILEWISPYVFAGIPKKITNLLDTMRVLAYSEPLPTYADRIFLANGTYYLSGEFEESRDFCMNRMPVAYNPDAPEPVRCLKFVHLC